MISEMLTAQEVANRVRPYVANTKVGAISLSIDEGRISLQHGYWRVPVRSSLEPQPLFPYYEALADLEEDIQTREGIKVTIASGNPLHEEVAT